jgi:hypothetical protein
MDAAFISAISALAGSVVGGLTSGVTTWLAHRSQFRSETRMHTVTQREDLYRDFIVAASNAYGQAITTTEPDIKDVVALYSLLRRMSIVSTAPVIASAKQTVEFIIDTYFAPIRSIAELHALMKSGEAIDPLREFAELSRDELRSS